MSELLLLCIIGRDVKNTRWNMLYDIFDENKDNLSYHKYDVSNPKWEANYKNSNVTYDGFVYLATTPKHTNAPYVHLKASASDDDIINAITELFNNFENNNEGNNEKDDTSIKCDILDNDVSSMSINCIGDSNSDDNNICNDAITEPNCIINSTSLSGSTNNYNTLVGIVIEVNGKEVRLHKDDAFKLRELMEFTKEYGYNIVDVIIEDNI